MNALSPGPSRTINVNMTSINHTKKRYDHRLRDLVRSSGSIKHATQLGVPRSTAYGWLTSDPVAIVSVDVFDMDILSLQEEVLALRKRIKWFVVLFRLAVVTMKASGFSLDNARLPDGSNTRTLPHSKQFPTAFITMALFQQ